MIKKFDDYINEGLNNETLKDKITSLENQIKFFFNSIENENFDSLKDIHITQITSSLNNLHEYLKNNDLINREIKKDVLKIDKTQFESLFNNLHKSKGKALKTAKSVILDFINDLTSLINKFDTNDYVKRKHYDIDDLLHTFRDLNSIRTFDDNWKQLVKYMLTFNIKVIDISE